MAYLFPADELESILPAEGFVTNIAIREALRCVRYKSVYEVANLVLSTGICLRVLLQIAHDSDPMEAYGAKTYYQPEHDQVSGPEQCWERCVERSRAEVA